MIDMQGKVNEFFRVFVETNTGTLCLTPRKDVIENKWLVKKARVFRHGEDLGALSREGVTYLPITKNATCTAVQSCDVEFNYGR